MMAGKLDLYRGLADELAAAVARGSGAAAWRVARALPGLVTDDKPPRSVDASMARRTIAVEAGFDGWESLRNAADIDSFDEEAAGSALVRAALDGAEEQVDALLERWPNLPAQSLACRLALLLPDAVRGLDAAMVDAETGPCGWAPLLYVCHSMRRGQDAARLDLAKELIALGADVNAGTREAETVRGFRTALGAAIGQARSPALAALLLEAGADIADGPTLYEGCAMWEAVRLRDTDSLTTLLDAEPPQWHVCHALPHALQYNDVALTRLLVERGGDPNWTMGAHGFTGNCLHEAVVLDCAPAVLEALLEHGAHVDFHDRDARTPLAVAICLQRDALADVLRRHGADAGQVREADRWVSRCFANDAEAQLDSGAELRAGDHVWLCRAIRMGNDRAAELLLAGGMDPNAADDDGARPLHLAAAHGSTALAERLIEAGADIKALDFEGLTPLDVAVGCDDDATVAMLAAAGPVWTPRRTARAAELFERAADAIAAGDLATLAQLLRERPSLATERSPRPHRCTLLHYVGVNGFEDERQRTPSNAVAIIDCLLAAGSDPNALCFTYRGGPQQTTMGLLTSSSHPKEAGLMLPMVKALARGGARLNDAYEALVRLADAALSPSVDPGSDAARSALAESASLGETDILVRLLDLGVDIDAQRPDGTTALHLAAIDGNEALVDLLLARGAALHLRDNTFNGTPAGWAFAGGHEELGAKLAARLREAGVEEL